MFEVIEYDERANFFESWIREETGENKIKCFQILVLFIFLGGSVNSVNREKFKTRLRFHSCWSSPRFFCSLMSQQAAEETCFQRELLHHGRRAGIEKTTQI